MNIFNMMNPNALYNQMLANNPAFKEFVEKNKGKSIDQIAKEYNLDLNQIKRMFKR